MPTAPRARPRPRAVPRIPPRAPTPWPTPATASAPPPANAPALTLSAADCVHLEPQVSEWFARGATEAELLHALTGGLPSPVHCAARLVERRLRDKLPPERVLPGPRTVLRTLECGECGAPGAPEALLGGLCRPCRGPSPQPPVGPPGAVQPTGVRDRMNAVRAGLTPRSERTYR